MVGLPANWTAEANADSTQWTIGPAEARVRGANQLPRLTFGAEAGKFVPSAGHTSLGIATLEFISKLNGGHPGLQLNQAPPKSVRVDGAEAQVTLFISQSPAGGNEADALLTVSRGDSIFYMLCLAPQRNFPQLEATFQQMMNSIRWN
jgi:hypothetical protein